MEFPEREVALSWVGRTLVDRDGAEIGACTAVFIDDATRVTEWVCSEVEGAAAVFIPAVGATESGGQVQVAVNQNDVANAPTVGGTEHISDEEEAALYRHYGIPHSREASSSLLPTEESQPAVEEVPSDATTEEDLATPSTLPQSAHAEPTPTAAAATLYGGSAAPERATVNTAPVVPELQPVADAGDGPSAPTARGRRRALPVVGGLAGMAVGVVVGVQRLRRRRPPTRTERILARGRAASSALSASTGRITASAAPLLETTKHVVRGRGRAGAVAAVLPVAAALTLSAVRRRRSATNANADEDDSGIPSSLTADEAP